ncbi:FAR1-related sequence 2 [Striga asiatica]|uniref:FAR1-related sequence 2 n=1 Tax=Striga asiatica TaxID=4170 RepID=A0A5A7PKS9_STRAF|nr:FAR1-related sequence 2 [Striga asiatica]
MEGGENEPLLEINPSGPIIPNRDHETTSSAIVMEGGENEPLLEINSSAPIIPNRDHETTSSAIVMEGGENEPLLEINLSSPIIPNRDHETTSSAIVMVEGENIGASRAGMEFKDIDNVFNFYKNREGKRMSGTRGSLRSQPTTQTDCKARISTSLDDHVLIRNDVSRLPDQYILHRWRKDVRRPYTRIALKYDGLRNSPGQLRYDNLCTAFAKVADLAADDEQWRWRSEVDKKKGAPRKVRKKSPLELTLNKKKKKNETPSINRGKGLTKELIKQTNEPKMLALETGVEFEVQNQSSMELNSQG